MNEQKPEQSLKAMEAEVLAEGREWTRQRLQQRLQAQAEEAGAVFPPAGVPATSADVAHGGGESDAESDLRSGSARRTMEMPGARAMGFGAG
jgi:hypothetical protein